MDKVWRTVRQHNSVPVSGENMEKLQAIAEDYRKVKNQVYARFGGIGSLCKLYPGYTVQNEMTKSGLREQLGLPSVYFYLAVFDALGDIKVQWTQTKGRVSEAVRNNRGFSEEDTHYLNFVLKVNNCLEAVLNSKPVLLGEEMRKSYDLLAGQVDTHKLDNYLKRQVRKHLRKLHADAADGFSTAERAYRYADHGIYLSAKEKRKRIFVPLTDQNRYARQLYIKLDRLNSGIEILVPVEVRARGRPDYDGETGISIGMFTMLTADNGHEYGRELGDYVAGEAEWIRSQNSIYRRNKAHNPGRKKYLTQKRKKDARLHTYINTELNRFFREEKPRVIYLPKLPAHSKAGNRREYNRNLSLFQRGYIRGRLVFKCRERSVEIVEVLGKDIGRQCSRCGKSGRKKNGMFVCPECGLEIKDKVNAAVNAGRRGGKAENG